MRTLKVFDQPCQLLHQSHSEVFIDVVQMCGKLITFSQDVKQLNNSDQYLMFDMEAKILLMGQVYTVFDRPVMKVYIT